MPFKLGLVSKLTIVRGVKVSYNPLSSPGLYIVFVLGVHGDFLGKCLQLGGILISIISLTKGVAEYQITKQYQEESNFGKILKSMIFILPHTLVGLDDVHF